MLSERAAATAENEVIKQFRGGLNWFYNVLKMFSRVRSMTLNSDNIPVDEYM